MKYIIFLSVLLCACGGGNDTPQNSDVPKATTGMSHFVGPCKEYVGSDCKQ